jgi:hypothetical protein
MRGNLSSIASALSPGDFNELVSSCNVICVWMKGLEKEPAVLIKNLKNDS